MGKKLTYSQGVTLFLILLLLAARAVAGTIFTSASDITVTSLASAINNERSSRNIATLAYNSKLATAADYKARDMVDLKYFSHTDPEGRYIWDKIVEAGYTPYTILGENLAIDFSSTEGLVSAWIASPTHRANILNTAFIDQGLGIAFGDSAKGQYTSSIANTFGAQPQKKQDLVAGTTTPKQITGSIPAPSPKPAPKPAVEQPKTTAPAPESEAFLIDRASLIATASVKDEKLNLAVSIKINGSVKSATATVNSDVIALNKDAQNTYSGVFSFEKYFNLKNYSLNISAKDISGKSASYNYALKNIQFAESEDPKNIGNIGQKAKQPDLYNVFKYIVIIFGSLFMLFLIGDTLHLTKNKSSLLSIKNSNLIVLLLILSTFMVVNWWH